MRRSASERPTTPRGRAERAGLGAAVRGQAGRRAAEKRGRAMEVSRVSLTSLFIKRPVMTTLLMIGILVFGIVSYRHLPMSDLPTVESPSIGVGANLPGAS